MQILNYIANCAMIAASCFLLWNVLGVSDAVARIFSRMMHRKVVAVAIIGDAAAVALIAQTVYLIATGGAQVWTLFIATALAATARILTAKKK